VEEGGPEDVAGAAGPHQHLPRAAQERLDSRVGRTASGHGVHDQAARLGESMTRHDGSHKFIVWLAQNCSERADAP